MVTIKLINLTLAMLDEQIKVGSGSLPALDVMRGWFLEDDWSLITVPIILNFSGFSKSEDLAGVPGRGGLEEGLSERRSSMFILK